MPRLACLAAPRGLMGAAGARPPGLLDLELRLVQQARLRGGGWQRATEEGRGRSLERKAGKP